MAIASLFGVVALPIVLIGVLLPVALVVALQVWLCRRKNRWLGLILPVLSLLTSLLLVCGIAVFQQGGSGTMTLEQNGVLVSSGTTAEVWGNPAASVAWLANKLGQFGITLKAGSIVMAGAVTAAIPAKAGDVFTVSFHGMGSVTVRFVE